MYHFNQTLKDGADAVKLLVPILNKTYDNANFERYDDGGDIDRKFSVDLLAEFPEKTTTWASKFRDGYSSHHYKDVTIELMNGTGEKGDFYRFAGGMVTNYIYGYYNKFNGNVTKIFDVYILNTKKLIEIPKECWKGNKVKTFPGIGSVKCYQNSKYGRAWFTAIPLADIHHCGAIEQILEKRWIAKFNLSNKNQTILFEADN
jgi:hypothetical protein